MDIKKAIRIIESVIDEFEKKYPVGSDARNVIIKETRLKEKDVETLTAAEIQQKMTQFLNTSRGIAKEWKSGEINKKVVDVVMKFECPHPWC
ncbi:MAG: hypothetical protein ACE5HR_03010 [bacterium]